MSTLLFINQVRNAGDLSRFEKEVQRIAAAIGVRADDLMTVMLFESGLNPAAKNPYGSASGLIQFTEATANAMGTTTAQLRAMSAVDQLRYVEKYLKPYAGKMGTLDRLYLAVFYPSYLNRTPSTVIPLSAQWVQANKIFDTNKDGKITIAELAQKIQQFQKEQASKFGYMLAAGGGAVALLLIISALYFMQ